MGLLLVGQPGGVSQSRGNVVRLQRGILAQDLLARLTGPKVIENDRDHNPGSLDARLAMANLGIDRNPLSPIGRLGCRSLACHTVTPNTTMRAGRACDRPVHPLKTL